MLVGQVARRIVHVLLHDDRLIYLQIQRFSGARGEAEPCGALFRNAPHKRLGREPAGDHWREDLVA